MAEVAAAFVLAAAVVFTGFVAMRVFQATRVPDIPILLAIGLLLGPLNRVAVHYGHGSDTLATALAPEALLPVAPYISALALIVILFDSGLKLDFREFQRSLRPALGHTLPIFLLTVLLVALVARHVFGMPSLMAVILGVAVSNVGQTVAAAIIRDIHLTPEVRAMYFIEMALYDLVSIPILVSLLTYAEQGGGAAGVGTFARAFAQLMAASLFLGVTMGTLWIIALRRLHGQAYAYMLTLAALLVVYALSQYLGGSGAVSVLLFGLVIGNRRVILSRFMDAYALGPDDPKVHDFHEEITFIVRTFFFLFLGINFSTGTDGEWAVASALWPFSRWTHTAGLFLAGVLLVFGAIVAARYLAVRFISSRRRPERRLLFLVYGRGLGTAVLATLPFIQPAYRPGSAYHDLFSPWEPVFVNAALLLVLLTVLASSVGVWLHETRLSHGSRPAPTVDGPRPPPRAAPTQTEPQALVEFRGAPRAGAADRIPARPAKAPKKGAARDAKAARKDP